MTLHDLVQWPVLPDRAVQVALRLGYRLMRHWWRRFPPRHHRGAGILVRDGERVLIVRHSYRPGYGLPGGRVQPGEAPRDAAMRELSEECAIAAPAEALRYLGEVNRTHIYEYRPARPPRIRIDNREVIEALFLSPAEATARNRYLRPFMDLVG